MFSMCWRGVGYVNEVIQDPKDGKKSKVKLVIMCARLIMEDDSFGDEDM